MEVRIIKMKNKYGLHVRPTKRVVEIAMGTTEEIILENEKGVRSEATDFFGLISLEIAVGQEIKVTGPKQEVEEIANYLEEFSVEKN